MACAYVRTLGGALGRRVIGERLLDLPTKGFLAFTVLLVLLWIGQAAPVIRENRRMCRKAGIEDG